MSPDDSIVMDDRVVAQDRARDRVATGEDREMVEGLVRTKERASYAEPLMHRHDIAVRDIGALHRGERRIDDAYRRLIEDVMAVAEADYAAARAVMRYLPRSFRRAVAVAAAVYEGIHDAIRRNDYDNVRRRAVTSAPQKLALATSALCSVTRAMPRAAAL